MSIITEEMRYRKKIVEYAIKQNNNASAVRRYHTSRMQMKHWRDIYYGNWQSLKIRSRRSHSHPNRYTEAELTLIRKTYSGMDMSLSVAERSHRKRRPSN